jgi:hypothetical protein
LTYKLCFPLLINILVLNDLCFRWIKDFCNQLCAFEIGVRRNLVWKPNAYMKILEDEKWFNLSFRLYMAWFRSQRLTVTITTMDFTLQQWGECFLCAKNVEVMKRNVQTEKCSPWTDATFSSFLCLNEVSVHFCIIQGVELCSQIHLRM